MKIDPILLRWVWVKLLLSFAVGMCAPAVSHALSYKVTDVADVFFEPQSTSPNNPQPSLERFAKKVNQSRIEALIVVGHADSYEEDQKALSEKRALDVKKRLIDFGIAPNRIYTEGKGSDQLIERAGNSKNRRVELEFVGTPLYEQLQKDFSGMVTWLSPPASPGVNDQWLNTTPIQHAQTIKHKTTRQRFLQQLALAALYVKQTDVLTEALMHFDARAPYSTDLPDVGLYAEAIGFTGELLSTVRAHALSIASTDVRRLEVVKRLLCEYKNKWQSVQTRADGLLTPTSSELWSKVPMPLRSEMWTCAAAAGRAWLLGKGLPIDTHDDQHRDLLRLAVDEHQQETIHTLIAYGANVKQQDAKGDTLLHHTKDLVIRGIMSPDFTRLGSGAQLWDLLVSLGADPTIPNFAGQLPSRPSSVAPSPRPAKSPATP